MDFNDIRIGKEKSSETKMAKTSETVEKTNSNAFTKTVLINSHNLIEI